VAVRNAPACREFFFLPVDGYTLMKVMGYILFSLYSRRIFTICYIYFSIAIVSFAIGRIASAQIEAKLHKKEQEFMERQLGNADFAMNRICVCT
jgi:hypothetical protein